MSGNSSEYGNPTSYQDQIKKIVIWNLECGVISAIVYIATNYLT